MRCKQSVAKSVSQKEICAGLDDDCDGRRERTQVVHLSLSVSVLLCDDLDCGSEATCLGKITDSQMAIVR